ncbi:MAG: type II toxin-antitoxin system RelE/ParE family toxin [Bacteroidetes bacterium]|nr:type II toxin-antitoxin system RelE/ParE family toxin [Bacteroidota bacterium]
MEYTFKIIRTVDKVPKKFLDHITGTDGIYEIRVAVGNDIFRIFCCFDKGNLVVLFNGFQKKTQKTPKQDLEIAEKLKRNILSLKIKSNEKEKYQISNNIRRAS